MTGLRSVAMLVPLVFSLASCSRFMPWGTCPEGSSISDRALIETAVRKLVLQSQGPNHPEWVRYRSVADFFERNPDCCYVIRPEGYAGEAIDLPFGDITDFPFGGSVELAIRYRRFNEGEAPYSIRHVTAGPCPSDAEESEQPLTAEEYDASERWRWNWRVR